MAESADHSYRFESTDGPTAEGLRIGHWNVKSLALGTNGPSKMSEVKDIILRIVLTFLWYPRQCLTRGLEMLDSEFQISTW